jgi:hypothetical protein
MKESSLERISKNFGENIEADVQVSLISSFVAHLTTLPP